MKDLISDVLHVVELQTGIKAKPQEVVHWEGYSIFSINRDGKFIICMINPDKKNAVVMTEYLH